MLVTLYIAPAGKVIAHEAITLEAAADLMKLDIEEIDGNIDEFARCDGDDFIAVASTDAAPGEFDAEIHGRH